jgi:hypothetical protein
MPRHAKHVAASALILGVFLVVLGFHFSPFGSTDFTPLQGTLQLGWIGPSGSSYQNQQFSIYVDATRNEVWINYEFSTSAFGDHWLQVMLPFTIGGGLSSYGPGTWTVRNVYPFGSIVRLHYRFVATENTTSVPEYFLPRSSHGFLINQTFVYGNRGMYTITLPYGDPVPIQVSDAAWNMSPPMGVTGGGAQINDIEVAIPSQSVLNQAIPGSPSIGTSNINPNVIVLKWLFEHQLSVIVASYTIPNEVASYADRSMLFGILVGTGIGVAADSFFRCYDSKVHVWIWRRLKEMIRTSHSETTVGDDRGMQC